MLTLAGLSFLGLGQSAPAPELGADAARNLSYFLQQWWMPVMPGLGVLVLALIGNVAGDSLRNLDEDQLGVGRVRISSRRGWPPRWHRHRPHRGHVRAAAHFAAGPRQGQLGAQASADAVAARRRRSGSISPCGAVQALSAARRAGRSRNLYRTRQPVASDLVEFFPATLELALYGMPSR